MIRVCLRIFLLSIYIITWPAQAGLRGKLRVDTGNAAAIQIV
jgi:hypothetical protein